MRSDDERCTGLRTGSRGGAAAAGAAAAGTSTAGGAGAGAGAGALIGSVYASRAGRRTRFTALSRTTSAAAVTTTASGTAKKRWSVA